MSTIGRTIKNFGKVGFKDFFKQMNYIGDTKAGTLIGTDRFGNKYFENNDELPLRTRWVQYISKDPDAAQIEPGWHAWMSYNLDKPPSQDPSVAYQRREWETSDAPPTPNFTQSRGAYKPYSTVKPKLAAWEPVVMSRK